MSNIEVKARFNSVKANGELVPISGGQIETTLRNPLRFILVIGSIIANCLVNLGKTGKTHYVMQINDSGTIQDYSGQFDANVNPLLTMLSFAKHWFTTKLIAGQGGQMIPNFKPFGGILDESLVGAEIMAGGEKLNFSMALSEIKNYFTVRANMLKMNVQANSIANGTTAIKVQLSSIKAAVKALDSPTTAGKLAANNEQDEAARQAAVNKEIEDFEAAKAKKAEGEKQAALQIKKQGAKQPEKQPAKVEDLASVG